MPPVITYADTDDINRLLGQLTDKAKKYDISEIDRIAGQLNVFVFVARSGGLNHIVGMAVLRIDDARMFTMNFRRAFIGDVVVDDAYRGRGIGKILTDVCIEAARQNGVMQVNLTSNPNNPNRAVAIRMYESMGFRKIGELNGSNYYRLTL